MQLFPFGQITWRTLPRAVALSLLAATAFGTSPAAAQIAGQTFCGRYFDDRNNDQVQQTNEGPRPKVRVSVVSADGATRLSVTGASGEFCIDNVPEGRHVVSFADTPLPAFAIEVTSQGIRSEALPKTKAAVDVPVDVPVVVPVSVPVAVPVAVPGAAPISAAVPSVQPKSKLPTVASTAAVPASTAPVTKPATIEPEKPAATEATVRVPTTTTLVSQTEVASEVETESPGVPADLALSSATPPKKLAETGLAADVSLALSLVTVGAGLLVLMRERRRTVGRHYRS